MSVGRFLQQAAAGNAGGAVYVDDVFSTYLYDGTGSAQTITNGIDLAGEGGLVWIKDRDGVGREHFLVDSERGIGKYLATNATQQEVTYNPAYGITSFNSTGFAIGLPYGGNVNNSNTAYASWTFRKQPGFFDVVTYTGNGVAGRTVSHNLGSVPGFMVVKKLNSTSDFTTYHRSMGATKYAPLNDTDVYNTGTAIWNNTEPTATEFTVGSNERVNNNGDTFVAYLFAHDAQDFGTDSDESIIKCGSYTEPSSGTWLDVNLGFEAQWVMVKSATSASQWTIFDVMRDATGQYVLQASSSNAEQNFGSSFLTPTATGFQTKGGLLGSGQTIIYVAIRRPHKPAEEFAATDLFDVEYRNSSTEPGYSSSVQVVDMCTRIYLPGTADKQIGTRLLQGNELSTNSTSAQVSNSEMQFDYMNGWSSDTGATTALVSHMFRRAPGFFDVVTYTGSLSNQNVPHNLGAVPEMMIFKRRNVAADWAVYHSAMGNDKALALNTDYSYLGPNYGVFNSTTPTASVFTVGANYATTNNDGRFYVSYLFASVSGISKVGSYTGTGNDITVDCGFSSGARFVLIKRWDRIGGTFGVNGDWYLWDSVRGIVAGNDPYLFLNSTAAQVTSTDYIDPLSSGFTITSSAPAALNASGGNYIFLAIA